MQFTIAFTIVASLASIAGTFATPIESRWGSCTPNFAGVGQSIVNEYTNTEWYLYSHWSSSGHTVTRVNNNSPPSLGTAEFLVQQDGQDPAHFVIKNVHDPNQIVTGKHHRLFIHPEQGDNTQLFAVSCNTCILGDSVAPGNKDAAGCTITSVYNGWCATADSAWGSPVTLKPCNGGADQLWNFWAGV